jgi:two-component system, chemotaxis family, CheB/CheR fusion protein
MPEDSGLAFVVVLHLSPKYESSLAGVLQKWTVMPVIGVRAYRIDPGWTVYPR